MMTVTEMRPVHAPMLPMADIRCPACGWLFQRTDAIVNPPKDFTGPVRRLECICKDRRCRKGFTIRIGYPVEHARESLTA